LHKQTPAAKSGIFTAAAPCATTAAAPTAAAADSSAAAATIVPAAAVATAPDTILTVAIPARQNMKRNLRHQTFLFTDIEDSFLGAVVVGVELVNPFADHEFVANLRTLVERHH
jgi:hypothetical protein